MSEQEKKRQRIYELLNAETKPNISQNKCSLFMAFMKPKLSPP